MSRTRVLMGLAGAAAVLVGIGGLSRVPMAGAREDEAVLRLSWRALGLRVEDCRRRTEEELAALAEHMRTPEVCVGRGADYELRVTVDGAEVVRDTIIPSGARHDRPVYVFEDLALGPGRYDVDVEFTALVPPGYDVGEVQTRYSWEGEVRLEPREIGLITLDPSGRVLVGMEP
jgi:hypothetical protein